MRFFSYSIRSHALTFIMMMGLAALILLVTTAWAFRYFSLESQQLALTRLAELEVTDLLTKLGNNSADMAIRLQHTEAFREAFRLRDAVTLTDQLNDQFHQYYHTAGILRITRLQVFDTNVQLIAESTEGSADLVGGATVCPSLVQQVAQREGAERLKPISSLCLMDGLPLYTVLVPVGGLRLSGYILVATDPAPVLAQLDKELGAPIQLFDAGAVSRYLSPPHEHQADTVCLPVEYRILADSGELAYRVDIDADITDFDRQTKQAFGIVLGLSIGVTLLMMLLALFVFRRSTILPLERLSAHLERIRGDSALLGQQLKVDGNREISELAETFNEMSTELASMQKRLSTLAYSDTLTGAASRLAFNRRLAELTDNSRRRDDHGFALFILDLNKFKEINDEYGHDVGDRLLQVVVERMRASLRDSDMIARLGGDEFGIILPGVATPQDAGRLAQLLLEQVQQPVVVRDMPLAPGLSIGISRYPDTTISREALLKAADHAMYQAKQKGSGFMLAPPCPERCDHCAGELLH